VAVDLTGFRLGVGRSSAGYAVVLSSTSKDSPKLALLSGERGDLRILDNGELFGTGMYNVMPDWRSIYKGV
jgi:hypothetical protein